MSDRLGEVTFQRCYFQKNTLIFTTSLQTDIAKVPDWVFIEHEEIKHVTPHRTMLKEQRKQLAAEPSAPSKVFVSLKKGKRLCENQVLQKVQKKTFSQAIETASSQESL